MQTAEEAAQRGSEAVTASYETHTGAFPRWSLGKKVAGQLHLAQAFRREDSPYEVARLKLRGLEAAKA
jgi:hypothetical protein